MNQDFIPDMWWRGEDEANSAAHHVVFQLKRCTAVLTAEDEDHLWVLSAVVEHEQATIDPPEVAEFLLTALATTRHAESMIGCLNERFTRECEELGQRRATRLYWARTLESLWPLLWRAIGKALKWGVSYLMG